MIIQRLIVILCFCMLLIGCTDKNNTQALGTLELNRISLQTKVAEEIVCVNVAVGTVVTKGQTLLCLDDSIQQEMVTIARSEFKEAMANLVKLRNGARKEDIAIATAELEATTAKLIKAEKDATRTAILVKKNATKIEDLDISIAKLDTLIANKKQAQENLNKLKAGARHEEIASAAAACEKARANLIIQQNKLEYYKIKSPCAGKVDALPKHCGEQVQMGTIVATILEDGSPYARVFLPETMRVQVAVNSKLMIRIDGIEKIYQGKVRSLTIDPAFTPYYALNQKERSRLVYLAEIQLLDAADLPIGLPVQVMLP